MHSPAAPAREEGEEEPGNEEKAAEKMKEVGERKSAAALIRYDTGPWVEVEGANCCAWEDLVWRCAAQQGRTQMMRSLAKEALASCLLAVD